MLSMILVQKNENFVNIFPGNFKNLSVDWSPESYGIDVSYMDWRISLNVISS